MLGLQEITTVAIISAKAYTHISNVGTPDHKGNQTHTNTLLPHTPYAKNTNTLTLTGGNSQHVFNHPPL